MASARGPARRFAVGVLVGAAGIGLAACDTGSDGPSTPSPSGTAATSSSTPPGPLRVTVYGDAGRVQAYEAIVAAFERENPDTDVELTTYPDAAAAADAATTDLAGSEAGADVFLTDSADLADLVTTERLAPVDSLLEERGLQFGDDYQRIGLTAFSAEDRLQCMPAEIDPLVIYYNRRLMPQDQLDLLGIVLPNPEDPTWGWTEFTQTTRAAIDLAERPVVGTVLPSDVDLITAFVRSAGGDVVDDVYEPSTLTLDGDDAVSAIASLSRLGRRPDMVTTTDNLDGRDPREMFITGDLVMLIGNRADLPALRAEEDLRFDVLPLPSFGRSRSTAQMAGWCIDNASDRVDAAADFVAFAVDRPGAEIAARSGAIVPGRLDIPSEEVFLQPDERPANSGVYAASVRRSAPMPYSIAWDDVGGTVEDLLERMWAEPDIRIRSLPARLERLDTRSETMFEEPAS